jgi:hypothetical protein
MADACVGSPYLVMIRWGMQIILEIPDDLASTLAPPGRDPARAALESFALEAYRERRLTATSSALSWASLRATSSMAS